VVTTVLAVLLVWFGLVGPDQVSRLTVAAFVRIPVEGLVLVAVLVVLPRRARWVTAAVIGLLLGIIAVVKLVDMGFYEALNRPFNPTADWSYFHSIAGLLSVSIGHAKAITFLTLACIVGAIVLVFTPLAVVRLSRRLAGHRTTSLRAVGAFGVVWILAAVFGLHIVSGAPIASASAAGLAYDDERQITAGLQAGQTMQRAAADDPYRTSGADLLTGLRGKDVIVAFVESYGQVAVQGTSFSPQIDTLLRSGTSQLAAAGFSSRSAFLTSPTFGGISWLAHATLESGVWIDNQQTYNDLVTTARPTLSTLFKRAGWRTVADAPANEKSWPEGKTFYHYDQIYDNHNVGYAGPNFSYATMPDQYVWSAFQRLELSKPGHTPVMAEIDLVSSHTPWAPLPRMVDWNAVGDGSVFDPMPAQGQSPTAVWRDANQVRAAYAQSIQYSMGALISWVQTNPDPNLVLVVVGDHQPATIVSGQGANHDVPISIIAHDPTVLDKISSWGWQDGLLPNPDAPVWSMDSFRNRFLTAYGR
jgi:hypothetical protein